jgi:PAS domain S-box-containing protein
MSATHNPFFGPLSALLAESLATHTSDFVGVVDESGIALYMNRSVRGADHSEVEGKPLEAFLSPERARRVRSMLEQAVATGRPVVDDAVRIHALDGSERWFVEKCIPVAGPNESRRFLLIRTETTHLRRAEEDLHASETRYRTLFESNPDPVVVISVPSLSIVAANPAAVELYGFAESELRAMMWTDLFHGDERDALHKTFELNPNGERRTTSRQLRRDGSIVVTEIVDKPLAFAGSNARIAIVRDVTQREQLEVQLRHAQKMEAMAVFAGGIAHDFNNMLTVIHGCASTLAEVVPQDTSARIDLDHLFEAVLRGTSLTKKLVLFSQRVMAERATVDVVALLSDLTGILRRLLGEKIVLNVNHRIVSALVLGDRTELEQLMSNLVLNAGQAIPDAGSVVLRTEIVDLDSAAVTRSPRARPGRYVVLTVEDDGRGMEESTLSRVFEPFFTTKSDGTGLGLAVVHGVVERHEGFLRAKSQPGVGTTISVYLPLMPEPPRTASTAPGAAAEGARVLVADDEPMVRIYTERMLKKLGYEVIGVLDGEEALEAFAQEPDAYAFVVLDVVMPRLKGPEALARMREIRPDLKAIFVSGYAGKLPPEAAKLPLLTKPFTVTQLQKALVGLGAASTGAPASPP